MSGPPVFRFRHPVEVRFKDVDVGGHAHHSHALVYFEEARAAYWREVVGRPGLDDIDYIMAEAEIRWRRRVLWPQRLDVGVRVTRLGKKHWEMEYEVRSGEGERLITGTTVQVMYDYACGAVARIPPEVASAMTLLGAGGDLTANVAEMERVDAIGPLTAARAAMRSADESARSAFSGIAPKTAAQFDVALDAVAGAADRLERARRAQMSHDAAVRDSLQAMFGLAREASATLLRAQDAALGDLGKGGSAAIGLPSLFFSSRK